MTFHDEVDIEEMDWNDELHVFTYQYVVGASQVGSLSRAHQVLDPPSRHLAIPQTHACPHWSNPTGARAVTSSR